MKPSDFDPRVPQSATPPRRDRQGFPPNGKVRYAVVGLGWIAQEAVLPAFANARGNSQLTALVSGDERKRKLLAARYGVPLTWSYEDFDHCLSTGAVDAVYLSIPNHEHFDFAVRAAKHGVHVLCEKPMALSEAECRRMISACRDFDVKLMIAYRLHFEQANLRAIRAVKLGRIGEPRLFHSVFTQPIEEGNYRLKAEFGGGPLLDIGIYCINASRYLFGDEPLEVVGLSSCKKQGKFRQVDESFTGILRFPDDKIATFTCSFNTEAESSYEILGTKGRLKLENAYSFDSPITYAFTRRGRTRRREFPERDQFGPQLYYFSESILHDRPIEPSGEEGLADIRIIDALVRSAREGRAVALRPTSGIVRPQPNQEIGMRATEKPELFHAATPKAS